MSYPFEKLLIRLLEGISTLGSQVTTRKRNIATEETFLIGWAHDLYRPNQKENISLTIRALRQHLYTLGSTGSGKTKLIEFLIRLLILTGHGLTLIDPHGDLYKSLLMYLADLVKAGDLPRYNNYLSKKLVLIEPFNPKWCVGFNPLEAEPTQTYAQVLEFMGIFRKLWADAYWGPRMEELLRNALITLSLNKLTLLEAKALLTDESFRDQLMAALPQGEVREYWQWRYNPLSEKMQATYREPILNRLSIFIADPSIRLIVGQSQSTISLRQVLDQGQCLLVNLSKGQLKSNAHLLGALLIAKLQLAALSRADLSEGQRLPHIVFVDEFQNFLSDDFETILSEARKYGLGLILAHQNIDQLDRQLRSAILGNTLTQVFFRLSNQDASLLAAELSQKEKTIIQRRLIDLEVGEAYFKKKGERPRLMKTFYVAPPKASAEAVERIKNLSLSTHGRRRTEVEEEIAQRTRMIAGGARARAPVSKEDDPYACRFAPTGEFGGEEEDEW
jgi:energy-coupling factor transporter ATP-binding protein EcfA2